jgi:hypothetical protein
MTTITKDDAQMLATLACHARPHGARQWKPDEVMAQLEKLRGRSLGSVICAVTRCAMDRNVQRPEAIPSPGSHWSDTMLTSTWVPNRPDPAVVAAVKAGAVDTASEHGQELVASVRKVLAVTSGPSGFRTAEDFAEANPELHARLERVRQMVPDAVTREPEPPTEEDDMTDTEAGEG